MGTTSGKRFGCLRGYCVPWVALTLGISATAAAQVNLNPAATIVWNQDLAGVEGTHDVLDGFGSAIALGDLNGDGFRDLVVGSPGDEAPGATGRPGSINILYRDGTGALLEGPLWHQDSVGVGGVAEDGDRFGAALAVGDFDCDLVDDVAIGVPGEEVSGFAGAGLVNVLYQGRASQLFSQASNGIFGSLETGDAFGSTLLAHDFNQDGCSDLVIGSPLEDFGGVDAGVAHVLYGSTSGLSGVGSDFLAAPTSVAGEQFGSVLATVEDDLFIGVPERNSARGAIDIFAYDLDDGMAWSFEFGNNLFDDIDWRLGQSILDIGDGRKIITMPGTGNDYFPSGAYYPGQAFASPSPPEQHLFSLNSGAFGRRLVAGNLGPGLNYLAVSVIRSRQLEEGRVLVFPNDVQGNVDSVALTLSSLAGRPISAGFGREIAMGDFNSDGIDELLIWDVDVLLEVPGIEATVFSDSFESGDTFPWD